MKIKSISLVSLVLLSATVLFSCGKASKAKPFIEKAYQEYKAASKNDAVQYLKWKNRYEQAERIYNDWVSNPCTTCNGYGVVYLVDEYGYAITDYEGNYQFSLCPTCGGTGEE